VLHYRDILKRERKIREEIVFTFGIIHTVQFLTFCILPKKVANYNKIKHSIKFTSHWELTPARLGTKVQS